MTLDALDPATLRWVADRLEVDVPSQIGFCRWLRAAAAEQPSPAAQAPCESTEAPSRTDDASNGSEGGSPCPTVSPETGVKRKGEFEASAEKDSVQPASAGPTPRTDALCADLWRLGTIPK